MNEQTVEEGFNFQAFVAFFLDEKNEYKPCIANGGG